MSCSPVLRVYAGGLVDVLDKCQDEHFTSPLDWVHVTIIVDINGSENIVCEFKRLGEL